MPAPKSKTVRPPRFRQFPAWGSDGDPGAFIRVRLDTIMAYRPIHGCPEATVAWLDGGVRLELGVPPVVLEAELNKIYDH